MPALCLLAIAMLPDRLQDAYHRALARLAKASRIYVKLEDAISTGISEYWLQKPNRFRVLWNGKVHSIGDGETRWDLRNGRWKGEPAEEGFPNDLDLFGFEPFLEKGGVPGEYFGAGDFFFRGRKIPSVNVKTTESAVMYGMTFFDRKTLLPLGHKLTEYADLVSHTRYLKVAINPKMPPQLFRAPK